MQKLAGKKENPQRTWQWLFLKKEKKKMTKTRRESLALEGRRNRWHGRRGTPGGDVRVLPCLVGGVLDADGNGRWRGNVGSGGHSGVQGGGTRPQPGREKDTVPRGHRDPSRAPLMEGSRPSPSQASAVEINNACHTCHWCLNNILITLTNISSERQ